MPVDIREASRGPLEDAGDAGGEVDDVGGDIQPVVLGQPVPVEAVKIVCWVESVEVHHDSPWGEGPYRQPDQVDGPQAPVADDQHNQIGTQGAAEVGGVAVAGLR
jgi:hypothetical protein